ncbi:TPA: A/G-specific adenine glycosylase [Candidatus Woesearchaeota archaeon]|nr:A/G-specific adenine glycosylase [Candidatus Woesearchaeota archaeon]
MVSDEQIRRFQKKVLSWYKKNRRDLPWRNTTDPYHILLSEVMLQQTQVDRVIPYYEKFLLAYPTLLDLAAAGRKEILALWSGLGYNSRVVRLHKLCKELAAHHQGTFPHSEEELRKLPGIGPYTANAILAFAFNREVAVVDTNVRRVIMAELNLPHVFTMKEIAHIAKRCVRKGKAMIWYNALRDYGATHLTAKKTGIRPISRQSPFEGSERQARGKILRLLIREDAVPYEKLAEEVKHKNIKGIIQKMEKEALIEKDKNEIRIAH